MKRTGPISEGLEPATPFFKNRGNGQNFLTPLSRRRRRVSMTVRALNVQPIRQVCALLYECAVLFDNLGRATGRVAGRTRMPSSDEPDREVTAADQVISNLVCSNHSERGQ